MDDVGSGNSIIDLGHYTRLENVELDMPSSPLESTQSDYIDVERHHPLWSTQIVRRRPARHACMVLGQQTRSDDTKRGMQSSPLGKRCDHTTSGVACNHHSYAAHTIGQCWAGHPIIVLESIHNQTMWHSMLLSPLDLMHNLTT